jgi:predicted MFS family arabinose efflux permease
MRTPVLSGRKQTRLIVALLACVLALESADLATVGAAGPELEGAFHISNAQLGLLAAISTMIGALATVPMGALTDRMRRVTLLTIAVSLWGAAMVVSAAAQDYTWLLLSRLGLGAVTAAAGPTIASLTGDFFPAAERGKIYGYILSGELVGAGIGFVVSGSLAGALSWRWAFAFLAIPAAALALAIWRRLPEPRRGGQTSDQSRDRDESDERDEGEAAAGAARREILRRDVQPVRKRVLREDPSEMPLRRAVAYVLTIPTNRWLIAASAVGYFFFAGLRTFVLEFARGHLNISQSAATLVLFVAGLGALAGVLIAGRLADRLIARGTVNARILVGAVVYLAAAALLVPALLLSTLVVVVPLLVLAAAALAAPNPPLDAARLDVMPARLWGRAEGVRTLLRQTAQAGAPLLFGVLADAFGGNTAVASQHHVSAATTAGLKYTFLIMLVPLALNGLLLLGARRSYPADVATAIASERVDSERAPSPRRATRRRGQRPRPRQVRQA